MALRHEPTAFTVNVSQEICLYSLPRYLLLSRNLLQAGTNFSLEDSIKTSSSLPSPDFTALLCLWPYECIIVGKMHSFPFVRIWQLIPAVTRTVWHSARLSAVSASDGQYMKAMAPYMFSVLYEWGKPSEVLPGFLEQSNELLRNGNAGKPQKAFIH